MNLAKLSIKRPIFITCLIIVMVVLGFLSFKNMPVEQFPDVNFPLVTVVVNYRGAGPEEIETLITKPLEDQIGTISGLKRITSKSFEGTSQIMAEFQLNSDLKSVEQQVRDKVTAAKARFPLDGNISEPIIRRQDPSDMPIITLALQAELSDTQLYDYADQTLKMRLEQIPGVGQVALTGGRKREIQVQLDRQKLKDRNFSVSQVSRQLQSEGENIPGGKINKGDFETIFRSIGEFRNVEKITQTVVGLQGNEIPTKLSDLGTIQDTVEDETSRVFFSGKKSLFITIYKQSGANTLELSRAVAKELKKFSADMKSEPGHPQVTVVQDTSRLIKLNVDDVEETIVIGIILTVFVVFFFLGSFRSTLITGLALPNSLLGAFVLMALFGFTINVISLLALTISVGLLIDDAIVVRENIFRHIEEGEAPMVAAKKGTQEVQLAVIATTAVVIAVFAPVGFMSGVIGQFMKQFGLTVCFAMVISLFDALTIAPMLSAYLAEKPSHLQVNKSLLSKLIDPLLNGFNWMQTQLEHGYARVLKTVLKHPLITLLCSIVIFVFCMSFAAKIPFVFIPDQDSGELTVNLEMMPGVNLDAMTRVSQHADERIRAHSEVELTTLTVGGLNGEAHTAIFYIKLLPKKKRSMSTPVFRDLLRKELLADPIVKEANPQVRTFSGGGPKSGLMMNLVGNNSQELQDYSLKLVAAMKKYPEFYDVDTSFRPGKPELQIQIKPDAVAVYGISPKTLGAEIRAQVEGNIPSKFRENGSEYNIRVRLNPEQRDLESNFSSIFVPNINGRLVRLTDVAEAKKAVGAATIDRVNRARYVQVISQVTKGFGTNQALKRIEQITQNEVKLPSSVKLVYTGDTESFQDMQTSFATAMGLGVLFIFLVLSALYESFITPFTIMLALPLAICGAFVAIYLAHESMSFFALLGIIMLLGVACKNSILLVDATHQFIEQGDSRADALIKAGRIRLRPILMTSIALIMGTIPVAIGLNEAAAQRTSMGYGIIGGVVSSTLLTLFVIPAAFIYIDRFRVWSKDLLKRLFAPAQP